MSAVAPSGLASRARVAVMDTLAAAGIEASDDAGAFYPAPVGVLIGLPALARRGLGTATYTVAVHVVSADPLNDILAVDRLYALADDCAFALRIDQFRPSSWQGGRDAEPLPCVEMAATLTLQYTTITEEE